MQTLKQGMPALFTDYAKGVMLILLAMISLSVAPTLVKFGITSHNSPIPLLAMRLIVGSAALWLVLLAFNRQLMRIDRRGFWACLALAVINSCSLSSFYLAMKYIDASIGTVILALYPIVVLTVLAFRGEPLNRRKIIRLLMALLGVILLIGVGGAVDWRGVALVCCTTVLYGAYIILIQELLGNYPAQQTTPYVIGLMALIMGSVMFIGYSNELNFSANGWLVIVITGLVSTAFARFVLFAGIQKAGSSQAALYGPFSTLMTVIWSILFLGESLKPLQVIGATLIIGSAFLASHKKAVKSPEPTASSPAN